MEHRFDGLALNATLVTLDATSGYHLLENAAIAWRGGVIAHVGPRAELSELPERLGKAINMHFEDRLEDGRMVFDYRMRPGVVEHSNALGLMRAIGLEV